MDLLSPIPIAMTVDFSTRCNLRCTYCSTGGASHVDIDMPSAALDDIADFCRRQRIDDIWLSASGETTMFAGWQDRLGMFFDHYKSQRLHLNSNFARPYSDDDLDALNKFANIQISIDSSSPELMKKQRTADLRNIIYNIVRFRQRMIMNQRETFVEFSCVLTRDNVTHVEGLASLALLLGASKLKFIEASVSSSAGNPNMPDTLEMMSEEEAVAFAESVFKANVLLRGTPTQIELTGALLGKLLPALNALHNNQKPVDVMTNFRQQTRQSTVGPCLQPWNTVMVHANGNVHACCGSDVVFGNAKDAPVAEIFNGPIAREFRASLLAGGPDLPCLTCPIASAQSAPEFESFVQQSHAAYQAVGTVYHAAASEARPKVAVAAE